MVQKRLEISIFYQAFPAKNAGKGLVMVCGIRGSGIRIRSDAYGVGGIWKVSVCILHTGCIHRGSIF